MTEELKAKSLHKEITPDSFKDSLQELYDLLNLEIEKQQKKMIPCFGIRTLKTARLKVEKLQKRFPKVAKRQTIKRKSNTISGIMKQNSITKDLADFLKVEPTTKLSRVEIQSAISIYCNVKDKDKPSYQRWGYLNVDGARCLQDPINKKFIIPDECLSKLFDYENYKKRIAEGKITVINKKTGLPKIVVDDRLQYFTISTLIGKFVQK